MPPIYYPLDPDEYFRICDKANIPKRIARGMEYLDEEFPGWEHKINFEVYNFSNTCTCIAGQTIGWSRMTNRLHQHEVEMFGFDGILPGSDFDSGREYAALHEAWLLAIKERFDTGNLSGPEMI